MVGADHALTDDAVTRAKRGHLAADLNHLARPLVAGNGRVIDGDDVGPREQIEVRMADPGARRADQDLVRADHRWVMSTTSARPGCWNMSAFTSLLPSTLTFKCVKRLVHTRCLNVQWRA